MSFSLLLQIKIMKKYILSVIIFTSILTNGVSQNLSFSEPDFSGQGYVINGDQNFTPLEKNLSPIQNLMGFVVSNRLTIAIKGCCSNAVSDNINNSTTLLIKWDDNKTDPTELFSVVKFKSKRKERSLELRKSRYGFALMRDVENGINFLAKKYGESSYLLTIKIDKPGEYGLLLGTNKTVTYNDKSINNKLPILCFSVAK